MIVFLSNPIFRLTVLDVLLVRLSVAEFIGRDLHSLPGGLVPDLRHDLAHGQEVVTQGPGGHRTFVELRHIRLPLSLHLRGAFLMNPAVSTTSHSQLRLDERPPSLLSLVMMATASCNANT